MHSPTHAHIYWTKHFINRREHITHDSVYTMPRIGRDRSRITHIRPFLSLVFHGAIVTVVTVVFVVARFSWHTDRARNLSSICVRHLTRHSVQCSDNKEAWPMHQYSNILPHRGKRPFLIETQGDQETKRTNKRRDVKYFSRRNDHSLNCKRFTEN